MPARQQYKKRTDLKKIQSQWNKLTGLHLRQEWSATIVRAATAAELAANFAIRKEFRSRSSFDSKFIDSLLRWANGLSGKLDRLLVPLSVGQKQHEKIKKLKGVAEQINTKRNAIAHSGEFSNKADAEAIIKKSRMFIEALVKIHDPKFVLKDTKL